MNSLVTAGPCWSPAVRYRENWRSTAALEWRRICCKSGFSWEWLLGQFLQNLVSFYFNGTSVKFLEFSIKSRLLDSLQTHLKGSEFVVTSPSLVCNVHSTRRVKDKGLTEYGSVIRVVAPVPEERSNTSAINRFLSLGCSVARCIDVLDTAPVTEGHTVFKVNHPLQS